jgi:hypothetical protein
VLPCNLVPEISRSSLRYNVLTMWLLNVSVLLWSSTTDTALEQFQRLAIVHPYVPAHWMMN